MPWFDMGKNVFSGGYNQGYGNQGYDYYNNYNQGYGSGYDYNQGGYGGGGGGYDYNSYYNNQGGWGGYGGNQGYGSYGNGGGRCNLVINFQLCPSHCYMQ